MEYESACAIASYTSIRGGMMARMASRDIVHHLYKRPGDLLPFCGTTPGPDETTGDWHTGHDQDTLLQCSGFGLVCCVTCLSPEALGGWTPLIMDDAREQEASGVPKDQWWLED